MKTLLAILSTLLFSSAAYSAQLDLLEIKSVTPITTNGVREVIVESLKPCSHVYEGVLFESVSDGQAPLEIKVEVRAVSSDTGFCRGADVLVRDILVFEPRVAGQYTFIPVQPK